MKKLLGLFFLFTMIVRVQINATVMGGGCSILCYYQLSQSGVKSEFKGFQNNSILTFNVKKGDSLTLQLFTKQNGMYCKNTALNQIVKVYDSNGVALKNITLKSEGTFKYKIDKEFYNSPLDSIVVIITNKDDVPFSFTPPTLISIYKNTTLHNSFYFTIPPNLSVGNEFKLIDGDTIFIPINDNFIITSTSQYYISADKKMLKIVENGDFFIELKSGLGVYSISISNTSQKDYIWPCPNYIIAKDTNPVSQYIARMPIPTIQSKKYIAIYALCETTVQLVRFKDCNYEIDTLKKYAKIKWYHFLSNNDNPQSVLEWDNNTTVKINKQGFYRCDFTDRDTAYQYLFYYKKIYIDNPAAVEESDISKIDINIAPNPVADQLTINSNLLGNYNIYDCLGHLVNNGSIISTNMQVDVSGLQSGIYVLTIQSNNRVYRKKFIK